jgi:hypothetical protein
MLTRVHVEGYKCLRDVTVELGPFNVLIGKNDSGKSSFMQAVSEPARTFKRWNPTNLPKDVSSGQWRVQLTGRGGLLGYDSSAWTTPAWGNGSALLAFRHPSDAAAWVVSNPEFTATEPISLDPSFIAGQSPAQSAALDAFIASRGGGTAAHLAALALGDRKRFDAIEEAMALVTEGRVQTLVVQDIGNSTYTLAFKLVDGTTVAASQMSQGLLVYLGFLALVHRDPMPGILLVEEPERGLHPMRLFDLVTALRTLPKRGVQVILATHSPDLLSWCDPSEVRIFHRPRPESPTEVHMLPADFDRRAMHEPLGQVWAARGEEGLLDLVRGPVRPVVQAKAAG